MNLAETEVIQSVVEVRTPNGKVIRHKPDLRKSEAFRHNLPTPLDDAADGIEEGFNMTTEYMTRIRSCLNQSSGKATMADYTTRQLDILKAYDDWAKEVGPSSMFARVCISLFGLGYSQKKVMKQYDISRHYLVRYMNEGLKRYAEVRGWTV